MEYFLLQWIPLPNLKKLCCYDGMTSLKYEMLQYFGKILYLRRAQGENKIFYIICEKL